MKLRITIVCLLLALVLFLCAPALAFEELTSGARGDAVTAVQSRLNALGYDAGSADGSYGGRTRAAVEKFQENNGLEVTGTVDEATYECLFSLSARPSGAEALGSDPDAVRVQRLLLDLGYEIEELNGTYDKPTTVALALYQKANGLETGGMEVTQALTHLIQDAARQTRGLLLVNNGDADDLLYGYADAAGEIVIPVEYAWASGAWSDGLAAVTCADGRNGYIDAAGTLAIDTGFAEGETFSDGVALVSKDGRRAYIDLAGGYVVPFGDAKADRYMCTNYADGHARVGDKLLDKYGNAIALPLSFQDVSSMMVSAFCEDFHEGRMCLRMVTEEGRKYGYIDAGGGTAIPFRFDDARSFSEGLAVVGVAESFTELKYGYIDVTGELAIAADYQEAGPFSEGRAAVRHARAGWGFVDAAGTFASAETQWDSLVGTGFSGGLLAVEKDGAVGFVDAKGALVIPFAFAVPADCTPTGPRPLVSDRLYRFVDGVALVIGADQQLLYIDEAGETLFSAGIY